MCVWSQTKGTTHKCKVTNYDSLSQYNNILRSQMGQMVDGGGCSTNSRCSNSRE